MSRKVPWVRIPPSPPYPSPPPSSPDRGASESYNKNNELQDLVFPHAFSLVLQSTCLMWVQMWVGNVSKKHTMNKIAAIDVIRKPPGTYLDGAGLYLQVSDNQGRSWHCQRKTHFDGDRLNP